MALEHEFRKEPINGRRLRLVRSAQSAEIAAKVPQSQRDRLAGWLLNLRETERTEGPIGIGFTECAKVWGKDRRNG